MMEVFKIVWLGLYISACDGYRILGLVPYNSRSHHVVLAPLFQELTSRGHEVTVVSSFPRRGHQDLDLSQVLPVNANNYTLSNIREHMSVSFKAALFITQIGLSLSKSMLKDDRVLKLLSEKYDLVITEIFGSDFPNYFAYKMRIPVISVVTSTALPWVAARTGLPDNPSYIPNMFMDYSANMTLVERIYNTVTLIYSKAAYYYSSELPTHDLARQVLGEDVPSVAEVNRRTSMMFVNSHFTLAQSRPFPPNVVEVGGIHIREPQPLPKELQEVLDSSPDGTILFSLGSLVKVSSLPPDIIRKFLNAFARLPHRVIFKFEESLSDVPSNVIVRKWLPQADLVAHPRLVAVVIHGGMASTIEAVHYAKPMVGVPLYSDQFRNIKHVVRRGAGRILDIDTLSEDDISEALKSVLYEPRYAENMRQLSQQFRDRPMSPLQSAVYWTEYVIRHQGAPHLRPASVELPLYQYLQLDVVLVLIILLCVLLHIVFITCSRAKGISFSGNRIKNDCI